MYYVYKMIVWDVTITMPHLHGKNVEECTRHADVRPHQKKCVFGNYYKKKIFLYPCPKIRNSCECNSFYTTGGNLMKFYHNAWPKAKFCMKARILCNMFHSKVIALLSRLPVGAFATLCVFSLKLEKTIWKPQKVIESVSFYLHVESNYSKHIFFICMLNHGELEGLHYENNVIVRCNQQHKQLHGFDVWWCNPSVRQSCNT